MHKSIRHLGKLSLAAVAVGLVVVATIGGFAIAHFGPNEPPSEWSDSLRLVADRSGLSLCVDEPLDGESTVSGDASVTPLPTESEGVTQPPPPKGLTPEITPLSTSPVTPMSDQDISNLQNGLAALRNDLAARSYDSTILEQLDDATFTSGCPPPLAADPGARRTDSKTGLAEIIGPPVLTPGPHRLRIYVISGPQMDEWFDGAPFGLSTEEVFCGGSSSFNCSAVTSGIYLSSTGDIGLNQQAFSRSLGFDEPSESTPESKSLGLQSGTE